MTRAASERQLASLKTAFRRLLRDIGGLKVAAGATRVSMSRLSDAGNAQSDYFPPLDAVLDLEIDLGQPLVTEMLALLQGYCLTPVAGQADENAIDLLFETAVATQSVGEWSATVIRALSDGSLSLAEKEELLAQAEAQEKKWARRRRILARIVGQARA